MNWIIYIVEVIGISKFDLCGRLEISGKVAVLQLGEGSVKVFCFIEDLERLLRGEFEYVRFFRSS